MMAVAFQSASLAAVFTVDSPADVVDASPGDGACDDGSGNCTLRAAIQEANALAGADEITLPAGNVHTHRSRRAGLEDGAASGDLDIGTELVITGAGVGDYDRRRWSTRPGLRLSLSHAAAFRPRSVA